MNDYNGSYGSALFQIVMNSAVRVLLQEASVGTQVLATGTDLTSATSKMRVRLKDLGTVEKEHLPKVINIAYVLSLPTDQFESDEIRRSLGFQMLEFVTAGIDARLAWANTKSVIASFSRETGTAYLLATVPYEAFVQDEYLPRVIEIAYVE